MSNHVFMVLPDAWPGQHILNYFLDAYLQDRGLDHPHPIPMEMGDRLQGELLNSNQQDFTRRSCILHSYGCPDKRLFYDV